MANKVTSIQNSQGVIVEQEKAAASSDINELQSVFNNRFQALTNNIYIAWSIQNSILSINAINLKNKVVAKMNGVSLTLASQVSRLYFFTQQVNLTTPSQNVYLYGLRSNAVTQISGADTLTENNLTTQPLNKQVSTRVLVEWTVVLANSVPTLSGWTYEGYIMVGKAGTGTGTSNSDPNIQYVVDYIVTGTAGLSAINSTARDLALSGRCTVLNLNDANRDYAIYQWNGSNWIVIQSVAQDNRVIFGSDILTTPRAVTSIRHPGYAFIYEFNGTLSYKIQDFLTSQDSFELPIASATVLGGIKVGDNLTISADGTLSGTPDTKYTLPTATTSVIGGVKIGNGLTITTEGLLSANVQSVFGRTGAVRAQAGDYSAEQITYEGTQNLYDVVKNLSSGSGVPIASATTLGGIKVGNNLTITPDGVLSAGNSYVLPVMSSTVLGGSKLGQGLSVTSEGVLSADVRSVFGRTGAVIAQKGDYTSDMIISTSGKTVEEILTSITSGTGLPIASATTLGAIKVGNNLTIDSNGVLSAGNSYTLPIASATVLGGIKIGTGLSIAADGTVTFSGSADTTGNAATATKLKTARTIQTNLASTASASFDGSANITPGVTGVLPIANGGTGASTASAALANLGGITPAAVDTKVTTATSKKYTIAVPASAWTSTAPYTNTVNVTGVTANTLLSNIQLDPSLVGTANAELANSQWDYLDTQAGKVVFTALTVKPSANFTIIAWEVK